MKRCPECRRDYYDDSLLYCLDDGSALLEGPASGGESKTAILHSTEPPSEAPTKHQIHTTDETSIFHGSPEAEPQIKLGDLTERRSHSANRAAKPVVLIGLAILILILGFFGYRYFASNSREINSIAVLPFENGSGDPSMDYLSDGLSVSLIDKLSELPQLRVIARASSFRFRGADVDPQDVGKKLNVQAVIMGRVVRQGDQLSVRVEMIDTAQNKQIWGEQYNRKAADAVSIQSEIAQAVSDKLKLKLTGAQEKQLAKSGTSDPQAYELMLRGIYYFRYPTPESREKAFGYFEQAVAADPNYAVAMAWLSNGCRKRVEYSDKCTLEKAEAYAKKALDLDPDLSEAHYALAGAYRDTGRLRESEAEFRKAIELNPHISSAHVAYSMLLTMLKRFDEGITEVKLGIENDPVSPDAYLAYCIALNAARRYDEAISTANSWPDFDRDSPIRHGMLGNAYDGKGMYDKAIAEYQEASSHENAEDREDSEIAIAIIHAKMGQPQQARDLLNSLKVKNPPISSFVNAGILGLYVSLGDKNAALDLMENGYVAHAPWLDGILINDPDFDPLRNETRFKDLLRRMGLPE